ncbi:MAG: ankyrin repeat domain-containing protein, partial [Bacteroidetes bacterium]
NKWISLETGTLIILGLSSLLWFGNFKAAPSNPEAPSIVNAPEMGLHEAVVRGDLNIIQQHIDANSDLNIAEPTGGSSPLISAATFGQTDAAQKLIEAGADVNFQNKEGSTPLITAAFFCQEEIVHMLLENGADPNLKNLAGSTALNAVSSDFSEVKGIYEYFAKTYEPMGMKLDLVEIERIRPVIADILRVHSKD